MEILEFFGRRIHASRTAVGLTLSELSSKCGIQAEELNDIEEGRIDPSLSTIASIARVIGTSVPDLLENCDVYPYRK